MTTIDTSALDHWIGRTIDATDAVTPRLVEAYRATLAPHLAAVEASHAPLGIHWCLAPQMASLSELGPDGHPAAGSFLPPAPLPRRMWAGGEIEILAPLRIGDLVTRSSRMVDIKAKQGRSGPLYIVEVRHQFSVERRTVIRERQDIVYRSAASAPAAGQPLLAADNIEDYRESALAWTVEPSPVLLFRYSALTFNGHRIHYDQRYATTIEGYDGLVVHGPLQASLMLNLAACVLGACPARFTYRGIAALFAERPFKVCSARERAGSVDCRVHDSTGRTTFEATATR